jgi:pyruvate dehydrogenase E1 component alpha subunit
MITAYRNHVQPIGMGVDPKRVMAELLGKVTGLLRNGWFHAYFLKEHRFYGGHGIVGQIPVGAGLALQINILKQTCIDLLW